MRTNLNKPAVLSFQVEPVATFESSALQSSWIQRLKPAAIPTLTVPQLGVDADFSSQQLWNRIHKLKLGSDQVNRQQDWPTMEKFVLGSTSQRLVAATRNNAAAGLNRAKSSNVKLGKPPLPPTSRSGKAKVKEAKVVQWKVHTVEAKCDQEQQQRNATFKSQRDLFAEFAARLAIKEGEQEQQQQWRRQFQSLTPVISPAGTLLIPLKENGRLEDLGFTRGSTTASLGSQVRQKCKVEDGSNNSSDGGCKPQLSSHCSNFPALDATASESLSRRACHGSTQTVIKVEGPAQVPIFQLSRRQDNQAESRPKSLKRTYFDEFQDDQYCKRSRLFIDASSSKANAKNETMKNASTVPLGGIWLQRWNRRESTPATKTGPRRRSFKTFVDQYRGVGSSKTVARPGILRTLVDHPRKAVNTPNAAAFAIVGTASRQLQQQYPSRGSGTFIKVP